MAAKSVRVFQCDRCLVETTTDQNPGTVRQPENWARILIVQPAIPCSNDSQVMAGVLCPACLLDVSHYVRTPS